VERANSQPFLCLRAGSSCCFSSRSKALASRVLCDGCHLVDLNFLSELLCESLQGVPDRILESSDQKTQEFMI
jgi:hypothetical protein